VNGFTDDHRAAFRKYGTERIYIAYDRDDAGERAAQSLAEELWRWASNASGCSSRRHGRERVRVESNASGEESRDVARQSHVARQRPAAHGRRDRAANHRRKNEAAAKEKITEPITTAATPTVPLGPEEESRPAPAAKEESRPSRLRVARKLFFSSAAQPPIAALPTGLAVLGADVPVEARGDTVYVSLGERRYRILGCKRIRLLVFCG